MILYIRSTAILFFFLCHQVNLFGQDPSGSGDDACPRDALVDAKQFYSETLKGQFAIYNGRQYNFRYLDIKGTPFYGGVNWNKGKILYDNRLYEDINIKFDIYNNILVIDYYDSRGKFYYLRLQNKRIETFDWPGHHFIHIRKDTLESPALQPGFYDVLYDGETRVLARYVKYINKNNIQSDYRLKAFFEKDYFFIVKDANVYQVKKKRSLLEVFDDKKREIKVYIKKHRLKFKVQPGPEIAMVASYYDLIHE